MAKNNSIHFTTGTLDNGAEIPTRTDLNSVKSCFIVHLKGAPKTIASWFCSLKPTVDDDPG